MIKTLDIIASSGQTLFSFLCIIASFLFGSSLGYKANRYGMEWYELNSAFTQHSISENPVKFKQLLSNYAPIVNREVFIPKFIHDTITKEKIVYKIHTVKVPFKNKYTAIKDSSYVYSVQHIYDSITTHSYYILILLAHTNTDSVNMKGLSQPVIVREFQKPQRKY